MSMQGRVTESKARTNRWIRDAKELDIRRTWGKPRVFRAQVAYLGGIGAFFIVVIVTLVIVLTAVGVL